MRKRRQFVKIKKNDELINQTSQLFKVLGDPTRLQILLLLSEEETNVGNIAKQLGMEQSAVSHQLKLLRLNHVIKSRKDGKSVHYSLDDQHVLDILSQTIQHISHSK
ncbi:transcriptional regulator [Vagococcus entomophilus]|uniref:Transcriptional regulator n=1 Tax=Vagococcus entomophilus TaxID=1160095 RepID=A0A430AIT2_9ENTE|nr:transcriptional regulator [Vagococcus entomophilus]